MEFLKKWITRILIGFGAIFVITLVFAIFSSGDDKKGASDGKAKISTEDKAKSVQDARNNILEVLGKMPQDTDTVEKTTWYKPWGSGSIPAATKPYWYVGYKESKLNMRAYLVHFSGGWDWVFWEKIIFSTAEKNWEYKIPSVFAGQSGGGKSTQIVMGGKYETLDTDFANLKEGYTVLVNGTNPIIRFEGDKHKFDYKLTSTDIDHLKTGLFLYDEMEKVKFKLKD